MSLTPILQAARRVRIKFALRDCDRLLHHIAAQRANDNYLERETQMRQAVLRSELAVLERSK